MNEQNRSELEGMKGEAEAYMELMLSMRQMKQQLRFSAACVAMQGLLANPSYLQFFGSNLIGTPSVAETVARDSVAHADALLASLDKEPASC
jgi:hypothetical protein